MLKIKSIVFKDRKNKTYEIKQSQVETFPLQGGEDANMVTTKVWNQHGDTPVHAFMETYEGEVVFAIYTGLKNQDEIAEARREITDICNPLNGTVTMTVNLNNGESYNRDITFSSAPVFPVGFENRNRNWQKVQLLYTANNPFWYAENEIVESFQGVEPLFQFPFDLGGKSTFVNYSSFDNKVRGSIVENPNIAFYAYAGELPTTFDTLTELSQASIDAVGYTGGIKSILSTSTVGNRPIFIFRYNLVEVLERKYGSGIWGTATTLAEKITIADGMIDGISMYQTGYGVKEAATPVYQTSVGLFYPSTGTWYTLENNTWETETRYGIRTTAEGRMDAEGFVTFASFMDASDGTKHTLYCTYADLKLEVTINNTSDSIIFGNVIPSNVAINEGQVEAPVVIEIHGACVNPTITNQTTNEFIRFKDLTMGADDVLVIDTTFGRKKVELNGVNVFNKLDFSSTFFNLIIGENEIDFSDETGTNEATINFIYRNLYITI